MPESLRQRIDEIYRTDSRMVFATLVRLLRDFDLAEEAMHEAFSSALVQWETDGIPTNPKAWLISAGRFKAIDTLRRKARFDSMKLDVSRRYEELASRAEENDGESIEDDRLRLIFTCCHPAIASEVQVALTLREVCGLTTEEIASAFLVSTTTMAQRIVRGKEKIRKAGIPFALPSDEELSDRLDAVLAVIYLVFNEGYSASFGESLTRKELSQEAIRLGRLLVELLPDPDVIGLLALMLLQESRRDARSNDQGDLILLEDQDRSLWNQEMIQEGIRLVERALSAHGFSSYSIQAAIAAVHASAASPSQTDWSQIVSLYDTLYSIHPTPVVELNRAVAVAMRDGPQSGLGLIEAILKRGDLVGYHLAHAAHAELLRRLNRFDDARLGFQRALELAKQEPEIRFLNKRLESLHD